MMWAENSNVVLLIAIALVLLAIIAWVLIRAGRKAKVIDADEGLSRDVLAEGAERASRNQALIDAAPAAAREDPSPVAATVAPATAAPIAPSGDTATQAAAAADDLTRIKGLGPKIAALLGELGVTSFAQIAGWNEADVAAIDAQMGRFKGRIVRDQWVVQAQLLAAGDEAGFAAKFGQNG